MKEKKKLMLFLVLVLAFLGTIDAIHLLEIKYGSENLGFNCDLSEKFSCTTVNHSPHSQFYGFPVAGVGLVGYVLLGLMSFTLINEKMFARKSGFNDLLKKTITPLTLAIVAVFGFLIQAYYTYVEFFVLDQYCVFCLFSQALIFGIALFALINLKK